MKSFHKRVARFSGVFAGSRVTMIPSVGYSFSARLIGDGGGA